MKKTDVIDTTTGKVRGYLENGIEIFKGIPYAEAPVGNLRFRETVEKKPWDGIFEALEFSPIAPQAVSFFTPSPAPPQNEDCLTLNIWTPHADDKRRPVLFWIHGGGFTIGGSQSYNGVPLTKRGNICLVVFNYRLGTLGNLYIPEKVLNLGFLDQVSALKWVNENIENFGGDPNNITIFGESAGGTAVCTVLIMPKAKGLFRRAIAQSGASSPAGHLPQGAIKVAERIFSSLGIQSGNLDELRKIPAQKLVELQNKISMELRASGSFGESGYPPTIDGKHVPVHPLEAVRNGFAKDIDFIVGTNLDEATLFQALMPNAKKVTEEELHQRVNLILANYGQSEAEIEEFLTIYKEIHDSPQEVLNHISTNLTFRIPAIRVAEAQSKHNKNTYMYLFTYKTPAMGGNLGATHALEIPFVFGTLTDAELGFFPKRDVINTKISENMMDSWINFARSGNPNHKGIPTWLNYEVNNRATLIINSTPKMENDPYGNERKAWKGIL